MPTLRVVRNVDLSAELRSQILELCTDAYEEDFTSNLELLGEATHVVAMDSERVVAHAAWVSRCLRYGADRAPLSCAYVEAVATPVALQRRGLGSMVLRAIPSMLASFDIAALSPSEPEFYARSGWEMWRGPLFCLQRGKRIATLGEEVMIYRLPRTPWALDVTVALETDWRKGDVW